MHLLRITVIRYYILIIKEFLQVFPGYHGMGLGVSAWRIYATETK